MSVEDVLKGFVGILEESFSEADQFRPRIDPDTLQQVARALPSRRCLAVGETTSHYPFVIATKPLPVQTTGKTRFFFDEL